MTTIKFAINDERPLERIAFQMTMTTTLADMVRFVDAAPEPALSMLGMLGRLAELTIERRER